MKKENSWQVKSLGEVCSITTGDKDVNEGNVNGEYPFFTCAAEPLRSASYSFTGESILLPGNGANVGLALYYNGKFEAYQRTYVLNNFSANAKYVFYHLRDRWKKSQANKQFGSATNYIRFDNIASYKIPFPPLPIQKLIAEILEKADEAKQKRKEANKLTDEFVQSVFIEMFGDPVKNTKGWETKLIAEISKVGTGGTPSREKPEYFTGNIPWVKTTEVINNRIFDTEEKITKKALKESNCTIFPKGTIVIALYGQGLTRGRTSILEIEACTNQACGTILPSEKIDSIFLWKQLLHFYHHLRSISRGGNQPNLNLSFIKNLGIIFPPLSLQQQFAELVNKTEALKEKQKQSEQELENLFQSLMQKAFKGELVS